MPAVLPDQCLASAAAPTDDSVTSASRDTVSWRRLQVWSAASFGPQHLADLPQDLGDEVARSRTTCDETRTTETRGQMRQKKRAASLQPFEGWWAVSGSNTRPTD